ncbi:hypothetical protein BT96DRAFT_1007273 [Gymnopus androsaceus JB14]|uniref:Uncharacterized protein n=1 Tax=Gymnopus androsaceus JB14 TaxID=1447944 RepID=A0A6A4GIF8_9AGAR|nr:hypothetical protein BT96DRAFT_1007273 [Gymnopus androsaceus JB14]
MSSISIAPEESASSIEVPLAETILTYARQTTKRKANNSSAFLAPISTPLTNFMISQKTDYFSKIKPMSSNSLNFLIFRKRWEIATAASGIGHLFHKDFSPPSTPIFISETYETDVVAYNNYT